MQVLWRIPMVSVPHKSQHKINVKRKNKGWRFAIPFIIRSDKMKYIDKGMVYIPINKDTTKGEMDQLKAQHSNKTVVFLRSGDKDMKTILGELIRARLNP